MKKKNRAKSLDRALDILEFISSVGEAGVSVSEVARQQSTTKSNAHRILQTFQDRGYLSDKGEGMTRRYFLGPMFLQMASAVTVQRPVTQLAQEYLRKLSAQSEMASRFAVLDNGYAVALITQNAPGGLHFTPYLGKREMPHCSGVGKALMSCLPEDKVREIVEKIGLERRTVNTITDLEALLADLEECRQRGFALDDEEDVLGVICIAAPIFGQGNEPVGAISISGLKNDKSEARLNELREMVVFTARNLSRQLGATV
jgi:IclR family acetate operon transcriptional repressor